MFVSRRTILCNFIRFHCKLDENGFILLILPMKMIAYYLKCLGYFLMHPLVTMIFYNFVL